MNSESTVITVPVFITVAKEIIHFFDDDPVGACDMFTNNEYDVNETLTCENGIIAGATIKAIVDRYLTRTLTKNPPVTEHAMTACSQILVADIAIDMEGETDYVASIDPVTHKVILKIR